MHQRMRQAVLLAQAVLVMVVGLFVALGINGVLAGVLVSLTPNGVAELKPEPPKPAAVAPAEVNALVFNRDLFNQTSEPSAAPGLGGETGDASAQAVEATPAATLPPGAPQPTDLRVQLVGTQVASDPNWSLAILRDLEAGLTADAIYRRVGATFMTDATIVAIERNRVYFRRASKGGQLEYIDIEMTASDTMGRGKGKPADKGKSADAGGSPDNASANAGAATQDKAMAQAKPVAGSVDPSAIQSLGDGSYGVPREMADAVRANPKILQDPKFGAPPQIQPVYGGGQVKGFRVINVQDGSVYASLGIQTGDTIVDVNGQIVDNPQKALAFFDQLGPDNDVAVKVNRKGRLKTLTYKLQ